MRQPNSHLSFTIHAAAPPPGPTPTGPMPTGPTPTGPHPTEPRSAGPNARGYGTADAGALWGHGLGCRMDRDGQRERGCRMDRDGYCGLSATLTDSRLPTGVACWGEPALPPHFKSPRSSSSKFTPCALTLESSGMPTWVCIHCETWPVLLDLSGTTTPGLRRKPSTCSQGLAS